ncbi:NAD-dependent deacylase [Sandaracinobacteroides saxicola]|uniref:NAD-dependent protein deacylase n=1 Tax=Sandaracinobacteroides saxicola TaxID=2759707 RepID=A0A7G5IHJ4_9SPHN|nr:NAD-dependent deacylase [Sandaracinobacteroides saxicola]QMW22836.1 NAD-dependent deacylase [Sandaracinobacteroides saxicola]
MARDSIVILTGAGISAESGVPTFRAADGLWEGHRVEDVATPQAFARNPDLVQGFYDARRAALAAVVPNAAHHALARLEREWDGGFLLVTQNVDDLHDRAGSRALVHMHGELLKAWCTGCDARHAWQGDLRCMPRCPTCGAANLRPDIVWFGEMPYAMDTIETALHQCSLFISIGTSGAVYPAAGFVEIARWAGARTVELNLDPSATSSRFHESRLGRATDLVPAFVDELLA